MTEATVFNQENPPVVAPLVTPPAPTLPQEVSEFVGIGKKYASVDDALKSVPHAQKHISTLEEELATVKAELVKRRTTEDLLTELRTTSNVNEGQQTQNGITSERLQELVNQTIEQNAANVTAQSNIQKVTAALTAKFGDQAEATFIALAQESGMSISSLNRLSATSPNAVLKLAGLTVKPTDQIVTKPAGTINPQSLQPSSVDGTLSARVKTGGATRDLVSAWKIAGQKVGKPA